MSLVMFDYDGVIADSLGYFTLDLVAAFQDNGYDEVRTQEDVLALFDDNFYRTLLDRGLSTELIDGILKAYEARSKEHLTMIPLFEGMPDALNRIAEKNIVVVITSNVSAITSAVLQKYSINCVQDVIGAEKEKSKILKIKNTIAKYPEMKAFYVGDTKGDIFEGKASGVLTVGVTWGWHGEQKLKDAGADYLVSSPKELAALFSEEKTS